MTSSGNNKLQYWTTIKPKTSFERIVELYLKDRQCLKFACLMAIKVAEQTRLKYMITKTDELQWEIALFDDKIRYNSGYVVDESGVIPKIVS